MLKYGEVNNRHKSAVKHLVGFFLPHLDLGIKSVVRHLEFFIPHLDLSILFNTLFFGMSVPLQGFLLWSTTSADFRISLIITSYLSAIILWKIQKSTSQINVSYWKKSPGVDRNFSFFKRKKSSIPWFYLSKSFRTTLDSFTMECFLK